MFWGYVTHEEAGTFTEIDSNINSQKYINILETNLRHVVVRHFPNEDYLFQDDNSPIYSSFATKLWKTENEIKCLTLPSLSPDITIRENVGEP